MVADRQRLGSAHKHALEVALSASVESVSMGVARAWVDHIFYNTQQPISNDTHAKLGALEAAREGLNLKFGSNNVVPADVLARLKTLGR